MKNNSIPPAAGQKIGEGSYEGARDHRKNMAACLQEADVAADARAAQAASAAEAAEAAELKAAEEEGRSHSKAKGQ